MVCLSYLVPPSDFHSARITREKILDLGWSVCPTSFFQVISIRPESLGKNLGFRLVCLSYLVPPSDFHSARITREKNLGFRLVCLSYLVPPSDFHSVRITREKILDLGWSVCPTSFLQVISIRPESLGKKMLDFGWSVCPTSFFQVISIRPESLGKKSWIWVGLSVLPRSSK